MALSSVFRCSSSVSDACFKCFIYLYTMLQIFHLDVLKVDRVLHMLQWTHLLQPPIAAAWEAEGARGAGMLVRGKWSVGMGVRISWR
jgi:hypothetical protein